MGAILPAAALDGYRRFSLYNSPFPAHDRGRAVDLYPEGGRRRVVVPAPVAGTVRETRTVRGPSRPYAAADDHLVLVDVDAAASGLRVGAPVGADGDDVRGGDASRREGSGRGREREAAPGTEVTDDGTDLVARLLHVDPRVDPGDRVAVGDPVGETVRSGFFAPWVADHVHLGVRPADRDLRRAAGSLPLAVDVGIEPLPWDGTGRVAAAGETYVVLDAPAHPLPGERWVGVAGEVRPSVGHGEDARRHAGDRRDRERGVNRPASGDTGVVLDGGLPHYATGGAAAVGRRLDDPRTVFLAGTPVGRTDGRTVRWRDVTVTANSRPMTGVSLSIGRDADFGVALVSRDGHPFEPGDRIEVGIEPSSG